LSLASIIQATFAARSNRLTASLSDNYNSARLSLVVAKTAAQ
jgi:hypothetical protein